MRILQEMESSDAAEYDSTDVSLEVRCAVRGPEGAEGARRPSPPRPRRRRRRPWGGRGPDPRGPPRFSAPAIFSVVRGGACLLRHLFWLSPLVGFPGGRKWAPVRQARDGKCPVFAPTPMTENAILSPNLCACAVPSARVPRLASTDYADDSMRMPCVCDVDAPACLAADASCVQELLAHLRGDGGQDLQVGQPLMRPRGDPRRVC
jgi:hypothetical protein